MLRVFMMRIWPERSPFTSHYDDTLLPFATGFFLCTLASLGVVLVVEKGRLFKPHQVEGYYFVGWVEPTGR